MASRRSRDQERALARLRRRRRTPKKFCPVEAFHDMPEAPLILVVDDEADVEMMLRVHFEPQLKSGRFDFLFARDGQAALRLLERRPAISLVFVDINMPGIDGLTLVDAIRRGDAGQDGTRERRLVMLTAYSDTPHIRKAMRAGANDYLSKPICFEQMEQVIEEHLTGGRRFAALDRFLGHSEAIERLRTQVRHLADHPVSVLLEGETGTGKSLLARLMHQSGCRSSGPFVDLHCGAIQANLTESELFGHVKGAFSGAVGDRAGKFRQANGGTLFLDEIGTLSPNMQVKLLKAIEEQCFFPVGSDSAVQVDVRILAASNERLGELVNAGRFRQDLYYRLRRVTLTVPPLRERRGDIPLLAAFLLGRLNRQYRLRKSLSQRAVQLLERADWPGNVRSLANVLEKAYLLSAGSRIQAEDMTFEDPPLPFEAAPVPEHLSSAASREALSVDSWIEHLLQQPDCDVLQEMQQAVLRKGLSHFRGNKTSLAKRLGMSRTTMYRLLKEYQLD